jgi:hypothetical protein
MMTVGQRAVEIVTVAVLYVAVLCVVGVALAAVTPAEFAGRWRSEQRNRTLDISPCGSGWCGVEVVNGDSCGQTVLRLDAGAPENESIRFTGRLQLATGSEPYGVHATLVRRGDALTVVLRGHTGGVFMTMRRTFDFDAVLARTGDPVCKPDAKVSLSGDSIAAMSPNG